MRVRFVLRKVRLNKAGTCPINCRITLENEKANEFAVGISIDPVKWDSKQQRIKGATAKVLDMNRLLDMVRSELDEIYLAARSRGNKLTANEVKDIYLGKSNISCTISRLSDLLADSLIIRQRSKATVGKYKLCVSYLLEYLGEDLKVDNVCRRHVSGFWGWLKSKGLNNDYCNKIVQGCNGVFKYGIKEGYLDKNPFLGSSLEWDHNYDVTCLSAEEVEVLKLIKWSDKLQKVVDSFLFMCYTGLHISDYIASEDQEIYTVDGMDWIQIKRTKTNVKATIPLHGYVKMLIEKYGGIDKLPRISGQKSNDYLKLIGEKIGTDKVLTNKMARKTFTDMALNEYNMSMESVAAMLGHTNTRRIKHYGSVSERRIMSEWGDK